MNRIDFRSATVDADDMIREEDLVGTDNIVLILVLVLVLVLDTIYIYYCYTSY